MAWSAVALLLLYLWAFACALQDARSRRIGNPLLLAGAIAALAHLGCLRYSVTHATPGAVLGAVLLALLFTLPGYRGGKLGAGDVKLLAVVALATGPMPLLLTLSLGALCCALWFAMAPRLWPRLPLRLRSALPMLAPPLATLPYAPFVFVGLIGATLLL